MFERNNKVVFDNSFRLFSISSNATSFFLFVLLKGNSKSVDFSKFGFAGISWGRIKSVILKLYSSDHILGASVYVKTDLNPIPNLPIAVSSAVFEECPIVQIDLKSLSVKFRPSWLKNRTK